MYSVRKQSMLVKISKFHITKCSRRLSYLFDFFVRSRLQKLGKLFYWFKNTLVALYKSFPRLQNLFQNILKTFWSAALREKCSFSGVFLVRIFYWIGNIYLRIQLECGKIRNRNTPNRDTFYTVLSICICIGRQNFQGKTVAF